MRKLISIVLSTFIAVTLVSCGAETKSNTKDTKASTTVTTKADGTENHSLEATKIKDDVSLTLPASLIGDNATSELTNEQKEQGFKSATVNSDGSVTYVVDGDKYDELIEETKESAEKTLQKLVTEKTKTIKDIEYNNDFSEITLIVSNQSEYEKNLDSFAVLGAGMAGMMYQAFDVNCETKKVNVKVKDSATGKIFKTTTYPDALKNSKN